MTESKDKTCCLPWNHLASHPNGTVTLCCQSDMTHGASLAVTDGKILKLDSHPIIEILNSDFFNKTRNEMLSGTEPAACTRCYDSERNGSWSKRVYENERFDWQGEDHAKTLTDAEGRIDVSNSLEFVELRLGNVCNLKCISCNSASSSKWAADEEKLTKTIKWMTPFKDNKQSPWYNTEEFYEALATHGKSIKTIYINGGEPLMVKAHMVLLKKLIDTGYSSSVKLEYSTNLTITDDELLVLWSKFKEIHIMASIDDLGPRNDIIRFPSVSDKIVENLDWLIANKTSNMVITVCQTISALNAENIFKFNEWCESKNVFHTVNFVHAPIYLSAAVITPEYREIILRKNSKLHPHYAIQLNSWLSTPYDEEQKNRFVEYCSELDKIRGTKSFKVFSILKHYTAKSKTFCIFPWTHFFVTPDEKVMPCCTANADIPFGDLKDNTVIEIWNNDKYKKLRKDMIDGVWNEACSTCKQHEHSAGDDDSISFRHWANDTFSEYIDDVNETNADYSAPLKIRYLDFRWNNTCNLKCRTCGDTYSSQWGAEHLKYKKSYMMKAAKKISNVDGLMQIVIDHSLEIDTLYFAGGEPLLIDQQYELVDYLITSNQAKNINLSYTLNGTIWNHKVEKLIKQWAHFKTVSIQFSIDHIGEKATYIRHPMKWNEVEENITKFINSCSDNVTFNSNTVVSVLNVWDLPSIIEYIQNTWNGKVRPLSLMKLVVPPEFDARNLNQYKKMELSDNILKYAKSSGSDTMYHDQLVDIANFLLTKGPFEQEEFKHKLLHKLWITDGHRDEDFKKVLPELIEALS